MDKTRTEKGTYSLFIFLCTYTGCPRMNFNNKTETLKYESEFTELGFILKQENSYIVT